MPSNIVTLRLPKELLKRFPYERNEAPSTPSTSAVATPGGDVKTETDQETALKRKGVPGPKPGQKRSAAQMEATNGTGSPSANATNGTGTPNGVPKPRGKPGPKKKMKV
jgi:hypothetical protein